MRAFKPSLGIIVMWGVYVTVMIFSGGFSASTQSRPQSAGVIPQVAGVSTTHNDKSTLLYELNNNRTINGKSIVMEDSRLNAIALQRALDMKNLQYYAHTSPTGIQFTSYFSQFGISQTTPSCENLLLTLPSRNEEIVAQWQSSTSHAACMLDQAHTRVGIAHVEFAQASHSQEPYQLFVVVYAAGL